MVLNCLDHSEVVIVCHHGNDIYCNDAVSVLQ